MLKKLLTGCLTIAMAAALTVPAMAAEMSGKMNGRAMFELVSKSSTLYGGDAVSTLDMQSQGRFDYKLSATEGDWTVTGRFEARAGDNEGAYAAVDALQKYVQLENDAFSIKAGLSWWGYVYLTPFTSNVIDRYCYGCNAGLADMQGAQAEVYDLLMGNPAGTTSASSYNVGLRDNRVVFALKGVGLQIMYGANNDGAGYDKTDIGLQYNGAFGAVNVVAAYASSTVAANENQGGVDDTAATGAYNSLAFSVQYVISEAMFVDVNYESESSLSGLTDSETETMATMGVGFAMALSETSGFMVSYDTSSYLANPDDENPTVVALITANYEQKIAGQPFFAGYNSKTVTDADLDETLLVESEIVFGARVNF